MKSSARQLAVCAFANERATTPTQVGQLPWAVVLGLHKARVYRASKSGRMFGGYKINGSRSNANVPFRSLIQLDIDTVGLKDAATGQILKVTQAAPELDAIRSGIDGFEWIAASSHWHEPQRGVIKYRVTLLPDRDIRPDEHEPILEALDQLLNGALDRGAWQWSQAFFLPSCPAENESDAFFVHNRGTPLPVDDFVRRGREIIQLRAKRDSSFDQGKAKCSSTAMPETPENVARVKSMLAVIDPDIGRGEWRQICWAIQSTGWKCAPQMIREWSERGSKFNEDDFTNVVRDFDPDRGTGFGTLRHFARQHGWTDEGENLEGERLNGNGGDVKNGKIFASMFRSKLLHIHELGEWLLFDPVQGWISAPPGEADRAAKSVLAMMRNLATERYKAAPEDPNTKRLMAHVERTSRAPHLRAMIEMAKSEAGMTVRLSEFDADPMLLGVTNGVLDLATGAVLPVSPDVLVSKRCSVAYDPTARCQRFDKFMVEVQPDADVRVFMQRLMGYCLTGNVNEQMFAFLYGHGANGKSVFIELMAWLLGDYARKIPTEMLMQHQRNPQGPSPDIVALKGLRLAFANETEEGRRLAEARVKDLTGGDTLIGRVPYGKADITFTPTHKLIIVGNHKPEITDNSFGMWRRVVLTPFDTTIAEANRDPKLVEKLKAEGPGVLNWMLAGLRDLQMNGLRVPKRITAATAAYRDEMDIIGDWIAENCETGAGRSEKKANLYADYVAWAKANGHQPLAQGRLTRRLNERGFELDAGRRTVRGLALALNGPLGRNL
jgi:putative DNA primase/helicase